MSETINRATDAAFGAAPSLGCVEHILSDGTTFRVIGGVPYLIKHGRSNSGGVLQEYVGDKNFIVSGLPKNALNLVKRPTNACAKFLTNAWDFVMRPFERLLISIWPKNRNGDVCFIHKSKLPNNKAHRRDL